MPNKKKPALSPEAARILEQYRKASPKAAPAASEAGTDGASTTAPKPSAPPAMPMHRSGTRGK